MRNYHVKLNKNKKAQNSKSSISPMKIMKRETSKTSVIKTSKKNNLPRQSIINPPINEEQKLFKFCIEHYMNELNGKLPYDINLDNIHNLGQIYYILRYQIFENISNKNKNENKYHFVEEKNPIVEYLFKNKHICDNLFIEDNNLFRFSQFIKEFSQKIKITSQDSDILMNSIINENNNNIVINEELKKYIILNKVNKKKINDYKIILILKGKKVFGFKDYDLENVINFTNSKRVYDLEQNKNKSGHYFIQLYLEEKPLETVRIKNDVDISNTSNEDFNKIMDNVDSDEKVVYVFLYDPLKYFDINSGSYKFKAGLKNEYESIIYLNCSKNDIQLSDIFEYVNRY